MLVLIFFSEAWLHVLVSKLARPRRRAVKSTPKSKPCTHGYVYTRRTGPSLAYAASPYLEVVRMHCRIRDGSERGDKSVVCCQPSSWSALVFGRAIVRRHFAMLQLPMGSRPRPPACHSMWKSQASEFGTRQRVWRTGRQNKLSYLR